MAQIRGLACDVCNYDEAWHSRNGIDLCEDCWDQGVRYEYVR